VSVGIEVALPEKKAARRAFERAAARFDDACFVHDETRARLLERLDLIRLEPQVVVDLGCATGQGATALAVRYPAARVLAIDSSAAMLAAAAARPGPARTAVRADAERLPLKDGAADLVFANLLMPWTRPDALFAEIARVLAPGGVVLFATLGPDTLAEVRRAFAAVDDRLHVQAAFDMHDLGDLAMAAGLGEPVLDVDRIAVTYSSVAGLLRDLRATGGVSTAGGRRRSLTGPARWRAFERQLAPATGQRFAVTVELILGQAFGLGPRQPKGPPGEVRVPVTQIRRVTESR
jgi:malonyl-CoA O-methyltransferase